MQLVVHRVDEGSWRDVRDVRLRALRDAPAAFWATYADEVQEPEEWWRGFIRAGDWFLADTSGRRVGVAAGIVGKEPGERELISMWVAPEARHRGIGRALVDAVVAATRERGATTLFLEVGANNDAARLLYAACGFEPAGPGAPLPHSPDAPQERMRLTLEPVAVDL